MLPAPDRPPSRRAFVRALLAAGVLWSGWSAYNLSRLAVSRGYFIPAESSLRGFHPTLENEGSGEWWVCGEDARHFFCLSHELPGYWRIGRWDVPPGFDRHRLGTWGAAARFVHRP